MYRIYSSSIKIITWFANICRWFCCPPKFKGRQGKGRTMKRQRQDNDAAIVVGAVILGLLLLKSIVNRQSRGYRCPECGLVIRKNASPCPRCHTVLDWEGVYWLPKKPKAFRPPYLLVCFFALVTVAFLASFIICIMWAFGHEVRGVNVFVYLLTSSFSFIIGVLTGANYRQ